MKRLGFIAGKRVKVAGDELVTATKLQRLETAILSLTLQNDIAATNLDLDTVMAAAGSKVPDGAKGVILEVGVVDTGAASPQASLRKDGETDTEQTVYIRAQVDGRWFYRMAIVEMSTDHIIEYSLASTAAGNTAALKLTLVGWIIEAE